MRPSQSIEILTKKNKNNYVEMDTHIVLIVTSQSNSQTLLDFDEASLYIWSRTEHVIFTEEQGARALAFHRFCTLRPRWSECCSATHLCLLYICHSLQTQYVMTQHGHGFELSLVVCTLSVWQFRTLFLDNMNISDVMFVPRHCQAAGATNSP